MPAKLLENSVFKCSPVGTNNSQEIRIDPDLLSIVGVSRFLEHNSSNSLGFDCPKLDAKSRRCNLNSHHCEQVPDSN